jgi:NAD(P)-dependent dehydrogenase (short-subunit alcohol dehydrogenase family)
MADRIVLVTGATSGLGQATALDLARMGMHVLVHGRNPELGEKVVREIRRATGNEQVELVLADLASQRQIHQLAEQVRENYDRLDVLVHNAGVYMGRRQLTADGLETTFAVNHLVPFLLTHLLLDRLKRSAPSRIVTVSSTTHQSITRVEWNNLQGEKRYDAYTAYALSKLGNILFTYALAERLQDAGVTANTLHPGTVNTKLLRAGFGGYGISPQEGAETPVYLAASPEVEGITGKYFVHRQPVSSSPLTYDRDVRDRLWRISEELTHL